MTLVQTQKRLEQHGGRFTSLQVKTAKGTERVCARISSVSPKSVRFYDQNAGRTRVVPLSRISVA